MQIQQRYLTFFLSACLLLSVFVYFRMLHFLKEEKEPLEFRYSGEHKTGAASKAKKPKESESPKELKVQEESASAKIPEAFDINSADKEQLMNIPGIGPKMAETLLDYLQKYGPFKKAEDLLDVPGIGEKKLEKMRPYLKNLESGTGQTKDPGKRSAPLVCPKCGAAIPPDNSRLSRHEKPYCPKCLYYLRDP